MIRSLTDMPSMIHKHDVLSMTTDNEIEELRHGSLIFYVTQAQPGAFLEELGGGGQLK